MVIHLIVIGLCFPPFIPPGSSSKTKSADCNVVLSYERNFALIQVLMKYIVTVDTKYKVQPDHSLKCTLVFISQWDAVTIKKNLIEEKDRRTLLIACSMCFKHFCLFFIIKNILCYSNTIIVWVNVTFCTENCMHDDAKCLLYFFFYDLVGVFCITFSAIT